MLMAAAIITRFLIIYCPSKVGTKNPLQVTSGKIMSGKKVVIICKSSIGITTRSSPRIAKRIPIKHSKNPKRIINELNDMKLIVCSKSCCTNALAGESPTTFKMPNQKKTTNNPNRATGIEIRLKKFISLTSILLINMRRL